MVIFGGSKSKNHSVRPWCVHLKNLEIDHDANFQWPRWFWCQDQAAPGPSDRPSIIWKNIVWTKSYLKSTLLHNIGINIGAYSKNSRVDSNIMLLNSWLRWYNRDDLGPGADQWSRSRWSWAVTISWDQNECHKSRRGFAMLDQLYLMALSHGAHKSCLKTLQFMETNSKFFA